MLVRQQNNMRKQSKYIFAFFALAVIFADELFYSFVSVSGITLVSGIKAIELMFMAAVAYLLLVGDMFNKQLSGRNYIQFLALLILLGLYYITGKIYSPMMDNYWSNLLAYGALCIPACYVGMRLARESYEKEIMRLLPLFVFVLSLIVARAVIFSSAQMTLLGTNEEDVFNYQNSSYYLSFCYSYCFYYVFFYNRKEAKRKYFGRKIEKYIMIALLFVCAISCLLGGGRGAFVFLVFVSGYLLFRIVTQEGKGKMSYILLLIFGVGVIALLLSQFHVLESTGFARIQDQLTSDDERSSLWDKAMKEWKDSPLLGHGLGSIWWTLGIYSHNIVADLLAETGIIGSSIILYVIAKMLITVIKRSKINAFDMFMLVFFLGALVHDSFSGYWFSSYKFYLMVGYVYGQSRGLVKKNYNYLNKRQYV